MTPSSTAWRKNGCAASSSNVHWWKPGVPKLMQPMPIRLIFSPVFPSRAYSIAQFLSRYSVGAVSRRVVPATESEVIGVM